MSGGDIEVSTEALLEHGLGAIQRWGSPSADQHLAAADVYVQRLHAAEGAVHAAAPLAETITEVAHCARDIVELLTEIRRVEAQTQVTLRKLDEAPMVAKQVDLLSDRAERLLERAMAIDVDSASLRRLEHRDQMIQIALHAADQAQALMMRFLGT